MNRRQFLQYSAASGFTVAAPKSLFSSEGKPVTKTILALGQSNALGANPGGVWGIPASVKVWNCTSNTDSASSGLGTGFSTPASYPSAPFINSNNMMVHCCRYLSAEFGEDINLVLVSFEGKSIAWWMNSAGVTGTMYTRMANILAAAGVTKVDAFLWHQGEADNLAPSGYVASWGNLLSRMTTDGYIDADTPIVLGEVLAQDYPINAVLHSIADCDPRVGIADISCFPLEVNLHFSGQSYVRAGLEYTREIMKLPGPFYREPDTFENVYVTGAASVGLTLPPNTFVKVKMKAENGKKSLFDANGAFVSDRFGVWEFSGHGCSFAQHASIALLDETGAFLQPLAQVLSANANYKPIVNGSTIMAMGPGDKVYLGLFQSTGGTVSIPTADSSLMNRLSVKFLGAE
jgi:hypothetical protein